MYLSNVGLTLTRQYERITGKLTDVNHGIDLCEQAVAATATDHPYRPGYLTNLSTALLRRYEDTGALVDLDRAIDLGRQSLAATPTDHPSRAGRLSNLGLALLARFTRTGALADLDEGIEAGQQAAEATPIDHPDRAHRLSNLSSALRARVARFGALVDLDQAIATGLQARDATPTGHPNHAMILSNLSDTLRARYARTEDLTDLDRAIEAGQQAADLTPVNYPHRPYRLSNLSAALQARFAHTGELASLERAVTVGREAAAATPLNHPSRAVILSNLGVALQVRFERTGESTDLYEAIDICHQAMALTPIDHPNQAAILLYLGNALRIRHEWNKTPGDQHAALIQFRRGARVLSAPPIVRANCGRSWATLAGQVGDWAEARQALSGVLDLLSELVDHRLSSTDKFHHLAQMQGLGQEAANAELSANNRRSRDRRVEAAWAGLESGRGVLLSQALETRTDVADLRKAYPDLASGIEQLRFLLNQDPGLGETQLSAPAREMTTEQVALAARRLADQRREWADQWQRVLTEVRAKPGFDRFGLPPTATQLRAAAGGGTVVAVSAAEFRCFALTLTADGATHVPLPRVAREDMVERANQFLTAIHQPTSGSAAAMLDVLAWLWDTVAEPILNHLDHRHKPPQGHRWPRIWWMPTGVLSVLPLHAAGHHSDPDIPTRRAVLDRVVSSYTPTVRALLLARQLQHQSLRGGALVAGVNRVPNLPDLGFAEAEASDVSDIVMRNAAHDASTSRTLLGGDVTRGAVIQTLPSVSFAHFACHAVADQNNPADSYLALYDQPLRVRDLATMDLPNAYLAYLSACTTATGSVRLLDEPIHIASAFQLAGFPHAVATLWPIRDKLARTIATSVYHAITAGTPPAQAVHDTICAIRGTPDVGRHPYFWASHVHFGP